MDTRSKILTPEEAANLAGPVAVATGYFDVLRAGHIRDLEQARGRAGTLLAVVLPLADGLLSQRGRAEMVAALRMVDYVVIAQEGDLDTLFQTLNPTAVARLEEADARRARELAEHVKSRQR